MMLSKANAAGHIKGVIFHLILGGVTQLQYADDSDEAIDLGIVQLKILLLFFECMLGLKINFDRRGVCGGDMGHAKGKAQCGTHAKLQVRREAHVGRH
jgi:hypothetical protein